MRRVDGLHYISSPGGLARFSRACAVNIAAAPASTPTINDGTPRTPEPFDWSSSANFTATETSIYTIAARAFNRLLYKPAKSGNNSAAVSNV